MAKIGFVTHADRPNASELAKEAAAWLDAEGHSAVIFPEPSPLRSAGGAPHNLDLLVSLGGDGTMLRSAQMVVAGGVPVLGVNFGRFGYLTAVEPSGLKRAVKRFLEGDYILERRMTVDAQVLPEGGGATARYGATGLNDVVLARPSGMHTVQVSVAISGKKFLSYTADSMIVATPTGSTGYNLSARGPILAPSLRCLVLTPVSPHMLFDRSLVLHPSEQVSFSVEGRCEAELIVDGERLGLLGRGEQLVCRAGEHDALFVSFGERDFEAVLKRKFHLADR
jgi:NAD+ kinase